ncbi:hypothetical protein [Methylobacterium organophilum]|nr:hypothetical protein [Methylobacterium organophilum]UMY19197.1 hypothetical protein MMB17_07825 [Methylobacterium organophilum]
MLTVLTAQPVRPEVEAIDRDPGIITLLSALVRSARRAGHAVGAQTRACHRTAAETDLFSSSTAWPYNQR